MGYLLSFILDCSTFWSSWVGVRIVWLNLIFLPSEYFYSVEDHEEPLHECPRTEGKQTQEGMLSILILSCKTTSVMQISSYLMEHHTMTSMNSISIVPVWAFGFLKESLSQAILLSLRNVPIDGILWVLLRSTCLPYSWWRCPTLSTACQEDGSVVYQIIICVKYSYDYFHQRVS